MKNKEGFFLNSFHHLYRIEDHNFSNSKTFGTFRASSKKYFFLFKQFNFSGASVISQSFSFPSETYIKANIRGQRFKFHFISGFNSFYDKQFEIYIFAMVGLKVKALLKCNHNPQLH